MSQSLQDIKIIRKKSGLTQHQLAIRSGVSQSLIAKVEANRLDPTFTNAKRIFDALANLSTPSLTANRIMNKKIITINPSNTLADAIKAMKKYSISQMPVLKSDIPIGLITESTILNKISEFYDPQRLKRMIIEEIMEDCPPIINKNTKSDAIQSLLLHYPVLLVADNGKLLGLITKSDMLDKIYS